MRFVLASSSPRRKQLLAQIGIETVVQPSNYEEVSGDFQDAEKVAVNNAVGKCCDIKKGCAFEDVVIAADTIVINEGKILGKPQGEADAFLMLRSLSGKEHTVMTGLAVAYAGKLIKTCVQTKVFFRTLSEREIKGYIASGEPLDKAGGYGIQGLGAVFVEKIEGCYFNVVGLPLPKLYQVLEQLEVKLFE